MIEDFIPGSSTPLSSVALQFLVLVIPNTVGSCSQMPVFVQPTIRHGSCVAIPPGATFTTQLVANSSGSGAAIVEIQTFPPLGTRVGQLTRISNSNSYYVNVTWTPTSSQQNRTHLFCFSAVGSDGQTSEQTCIDLLPGYFPPAPLPATALPNRQLVHPSNNTTWRVRFDTSIERSSVVANITFHEYESEEEVYSIEASQSTREVTLEYPNRLSITPSFSFAEKTRFYINFDRQVVQVVQGLEQCTPGNEPVIDKNFWSFETMDVTPPTISFLVSSTVSNGNISFSWESNENVSWTCVLEQGSMESPVNCSDAYWKGYGLSEGPYVLQIRATDEAGNVATLTHVFQVDLTPPIAAILRKPSSLSNERMSTLTFSCNEYPCSYECRFISNTTEGNPLSCNSGRFTTPVLQANISYTFHVRATDQVGNQGESVSYSWETDFEAPRIFGIQNTSVLCNDTQPASTHQVQAVDNRPENVLLMYSDIRMGCSISRTWRATDMAGNTALLVQNIHLESIPTVSLLLQVSLPCESAAVSLQVTSSTASAPNLCGLPLQLTYEDSEQHVCPGTFTRNWTVISCGRSATVSQRIILYDVCPPHACGRNESAPRGNCFLGECQCNQPWHGENCDTIIYEPVAEPVNNSTLQEGQGYTTTVAVFRGTPPLTWTLISGPRQLVMDQYTGQVTWRRARVGSHLVIVRIENRVGRIQIEWRLQVMPGYSAVVSSVSSTIFPYSQPVLFDGYVEYTENNLIQADQAGIVLVHIDIVTNGATRTAQTYTTSSGNFSLTFFPLSTEYGTYTAGGRHPSSLQSQPQVQWRILGMRAVPDRVTLNGEAVGAFERIFRNTTFIHNNGPGRLTGITTALLLPSTRDIIVEIFLRGSPSNIVLEPGEQLAMDIRVTTSRPLRGLFPIVVEAREGTRIQLIVNLRIEPILPSLSIDPASLNARIVRGRSRIFEFNVTNVGRATANNVQLIIPDTNFISFVSFGNMQQFSGGGSLRLQSSESALFSILAQIPEVQQLGDITATVVLSSNEALVSLPISLTVSSDYLMNLTVVVEDEYTYFASGRPLVNDAIVTLINYQRNSRLSLSTSTGNGSVEFSNIYEDRYEMFVEAPSHRTLRQIIVTSVELPMVTVFIERQAVTYTWSVTPVTYQDVYVISVEADFETNVPIPVVTVTPNEINLDDIEAGLVTSFQINVTNHGLIRADNVGVELPTHPSLEFSTSTELLGHLEPLSSVLVSVHSSRRSLQKRNAVVITKSVLYLINIVYDYICGEIQIRRTPVVLRQSQTVIVSNPVNLRSYLINYNDPGVSGGGSFSFSGFVAETPAFCNPCVSAIMNCLAPSVLDILRVPLAGCIPLVLGGINPISSVSNALCWLQCAFGNGITGLLNCARNQNLFGKCLQSITSRRRRSIRRTLDELVEALYPIQQSMALGTEVLGDELWISVGDPQWLSNVLRPALDDESEANVLISAAELSAILTAPPPNGSTIEMVARLVERVNNTLFAWNSGQLEPPEGSNMASFSRVQDLARNIDTYNAMAVERGFSSYIDAYNFAGGEVNLISDLEREVGVCAVVRIRIEQELAITREAFLARLEIGNMEDSPLQQIYVQIMATDLVSGEQATHLFSIGNETLSGSLVRDIGGSWSLPSSATGALEWLIIPYSEAAPDADHVYNVGGSFSYLFDGENITVPLLPTPITVRPDPSLLVHYFWERYVVGDDPFTDDVEPSVPFTLGVAVRNAGNGTAYSLQISSAQPEIIDNERGLLINFMIIGANIDGESVSPSLTIRFGDLVPNTTAVARWFMISSLQGEFMSYSATFENMNPLGDPRLSILDDLQIHELIRNVDMYTSNEDDGILDFLVNDRNDYLAYPDALYSSRTLEQYNVSAGAVLSVQTNSEHMAVSLTVRTSTNNTGWVYFRYEDTQNMLSNTASSINGTKHEGGQIVVLPSQNSWITRDRDETLYLHILDHLETSNEEVVFTLDLCMVDCPSTDMPFTPPTVKLPTPSVTISILPGQLYAGTEVPLTLTCDVDFDPSLASFVNVSVTWLRGTSPLTNAIDRVSILSSLLDSRFTSNLTLYPISAADSTNFTCRAGIISSDGLTSVIASDVDEVTVQVNVQVPHVPTVSIAVSRDSTIAGNTFSLTCSLVATPVNGTNDPVLTWRGPGVEQNSVQLSSNSSISVLTFNPLRTSHGGVYTCEARLGTSDLASSVSEIVTVQIPSPVVVIMEHPIPYNGTVFTLNGVVQLDHSVDTNVTAVGIWSSSDSLQVTISPPYIISLEFQPLTSYNSMEYTMNVTIGPTDNSSFIIANITSIVYRLIVQPLPSSVPTITVTSRLLSSSDSCGEARILNCSANPVEKLFNPPNITWIGPDGYEVLTRGGSNPMIGPQTGEIVFSNITSNNSGTYVCRAVINIPESQIFNHYDDATIIVNTDTPGPVRNLKCDESLSPSELSFSWELPAILGEGVNGYGVEVKELRHRPGTKDVILVNVADFDTKIRWAFLDQALTGMVPYEIILIAINSAGCGEQQSIYCFTKEGVPPPPKNVVVSRINSTAIEVSWDGKTLVELKGLAEYVVEYNQIVSRRRKSSNTVTVPWTENNVVISNLLPGVEYSVTVSISTSVGMSDPVTVGGLPAPSETGMKYLLIIIIGVVLGSVLVISITAAVIVVFALRIRRHEFKPKPNRSLPYEMPVSAM